MKKAMDMFCDLRMFDKAKEFTDPSDPEGLKSPLLPLALFSPPCALLSSFLLSLSLPPCVLLARFCQISDAEASRVVQDGKRPHGMISHRMNPSWCLFLYFVVE